MGAADGADDALDAGPRAACGAVVMVPPLALSEIVTPFAPFAVTLVAFVSAIDTEPAALFAVNVAVFR